MLSRRTFTAATGALALAPSAWAQTSLRGADLAGDVAILRDTYETLHPGLYRYNTPGEIRARFRTLTRAWGRDQSLAEAYLSLSRFLGAIRCGHSYANFYNQSEAVRAALFDAQPRLPFQFAWLGERMIVTRNASGDARLEPGAEIMAINGAPVRHILRTLMSYARADGGNNFKRRALLEVSGADSYETFDIFYGLVFQPGPRFRLRVRPFGATEVHAFSAGAIDLAMRRAQMRNGELSDAGAGWTLTFPRSEIAVLTTPNWAMYNTRWDWRGFLDASFNEIAARGATRLVVDIRGNEGGNDCGDAIIARLIDAPMARERYERRVRYQRTPERLDAYLDTWDDSFRDWGARATPIGDGFYRLSAEAEDEVITPKGPRFRGDVVILIDAQNSSATFQFANSIQQNRLGRLLGQPTGGNKRGINGGAFFFLRLPASGLECDVPLIGRFPLSAMPDAGLAPDIAIGDSVEDIAAGRDTAMAAALSL
ncbi:MAG: S41 family peptidase [Hyphomonadaceae bacterium]|nr:S41 family peptidase [Hyphomonadaceae bacterium]